MKQVQTKREITALLESAGIRPKKRFGQNFLIDGNLMRRLVASAELEPSDTVIEVGSGTGGLTDLLADSVGKLVCVEIDRTLLDILEDRFGEHGNVSFLCGDVLQGKHSLMPELVAKLGEFASEGQGHVKLVANLPYQIATPLVMNLLIDYPQVRRMCFTVQAEVGERITATPNTREYGPLSILSQTLSEIAIVAKLPRTAFWPAPAVDSVMLRMDVSEFPFANREELGRFVTLVRGAFDHRRKTLRSALGYVLEPEQREAVCSAVDATRRPESFTIREWMAIHRTLPRNASG